MTFQSVTNFQYNKESRHLLSKGLEPLQVVGHMAHNVILNVSHHWNVAVYLIDQGEEERDVAMYFYYFERLACLNVRNVVRNVVHLRCPRAVRPFFDAFPCRDTDDPEKKWLL
ncbi:hypothetical protein AVEN_201752-1 [Araneus ventricosus]|uniref:Uncharacterized protein n=1 Tax=Araneus ventricosus TaxID=182803 RepID=A0A4Y2KEU9_ARAVE|nr:hypothetical protein AVEN_201752-1 [Araneus ventricosus]